jgi:DNA-binding response OmpR family regulator
MNDPRKRILIVEDEKAFAEMVKLRLDLEGYECMIVGDTQTGITEASTGVYDFLVLDLMLPGGGGLAVLQEIRKNPETAGIPVVVLTGQTVTPEVKAKLVDKGISALFIKPYDPERFLETVHMLINK